jgi:MoaA/NifB/PqqE/SkfB family radical SAM enzyme
MKDIIIVPTARCDRGCRHCMFDATPYGESISPSILSSLPREIRRLGPGEKTICITGGGEPLLYPWLPELVSELFRDRDNLVNLVTSGCRNEQDTGYRALEEITSNIRGSKLQIHLSFNAFNPTSEERLRFTLPLARKLNGHVTIKVALSYADTSPIATIDSVLTSMGYKDSIKVVVGKRSALNASDSNSLAEYSDFSDSLYFRENDFDPSDPWQGYSHYGSQIVTVEPHNLRFEGRLDSIVDDFDEIFEHTSLKPRCPFLHDEDEALLIDSTGCIYPCVMVLPSNDRSLAIGLLGETPLWEALRARENMLTKMRERVFRNGKLHSNSCGYCCDNRTGA